MSQPMKIGVLALQGGFELHENRIRDLGCTPVQIKKKEELPQINGLIIPGGESTTLLKLCDQEFRSGITEFVKKGLPLFTTCAGTILIAKKVSNPPQESLNLIDIEVERNAYGRQVDSFITKNIVCNKDFSSQAFEVVFIRAPKISYVGQNVNVLISLNNDPILVEFKNIMAATFHPELNDDSYLVHDYFLKKCRG